MGASGVSPKPDQVELGPYLPSTLTVWLQECGLWKGHHLPLSAKGERLQRLLRCPLVADPGCGPGRDHGEDQVVQAQRRASFGL